MTKTSVDIENEIKSMFDNNKLEDLKKFLTKRQYLNTCNVVMIYLFHLVQSVGVLMSSIGASTDNTNFIWIGVSLNTLASIIMIYEKINDGQLKILYNDIQAIKNNNYVDESQIIYIENELLTKKSKKHSSPPNLNKHNRDNRDNA
jgi:hypothetical protein